jgi:hypothetical protein
MNPERSATLSRDDAIRLEAVALSSWLLRVAIRRCGALC